MIWFTFKYIFPLSLSLFLSLSLSLSPFAAYKTLPGGDEQLLEKALQDMDASNYLEHLSEADALIVPSIFNGNLDGVLPLITSTPTAMNGGDLIKATELPSSNNILLQQQQQQQPSFNANNQNGNSQNGNNNGNGIQLQPSLNYNPGGFGGNSNFGPQIDLNNPLVLGAALQNPGLAAMYFGLQQLSQQATQYTHNHQTNRVLGHWYSFQHKSSQLLWW